MSSLMEGARQDRSNLTRTAWNDYLHNAVPLLWLWQQTQLRQHTESIRNAPMLDDLALLKAADAGEWLHKIIAYLLQTLKPHAAPFDSSARQVIL